MHPNDIEPTRPHTTIDAGSAPSPTDRLIALLLTAAIVATGLLLPSSSALAQPPRPASTHDTLASSPSSPTRSSVHSAPPPPTTTPVSDATRISHPDSSDAGPDSDSELFGALEEIENPALEDHVAGDLSGAEILIVVIFLIIFFPVGIILLIVFLVDDE